MSRLQMGMIRYASVATAISRALGVERVPECRIGHGRITLTFRRLGASCWPEAEQIEHALRVAAIARAVLASDPRRAVRQRGSRAIEVIYEDATLVRGCAIEAQWKCVIPVDSLAQPSEVTLE